MKRTLLALSLLVSTSSLLAQTYNIALRYIPSQRVMSVQSTVATHNLSYELERMLDSVYSYLNQYNVTPAGPAYTRYYTSGTNGFVTVETGVPIPFAFPGNGNGFVVRRYLPAGQVATTMHIGSLDTIDYAYQAIERYMYLTGKYSMGAPWEVYLNIPSNSPIGQQRTVVYWPISTIAP